ncbi:MAG TPA: hypothetical protein VGS18_05385 [Thermoplasmata archaeon]|nr:hypothetical protein [Thermoplasmata archaeon]
MFCPICGRGMAGPQRAAVAFPMHVCGVDGVIYDQRRSQWYGLPEIGEKLCCPACGARMDTEPKGPPVRVFFCYQCGTTYDRNRSTWYGIAYHVSAPA